MLKYLFFILIIVSLVLPFQADANGFLSGPIVPCGRCCEQFEQVQIGDKTVTRCKVACPGVNLETAHPCELCHLFELANNVIQFLVQFVLVIAPIFILIGGIMILASAGSPDRVALGKRIITSAVIGVIIALGAWTILRTLFNTLIGGPGIPWPWDNPNCPI